MYTWITYDVVIQVCWKLNALFTNGRTTTWQCHHINSWGVENIFIFFFFKYIMYLALHTLWHASIRVHRLGHSVTLFISFTQKRPVRIKIKRYIIVFFNKNIETDSRRRRENIEYGQILQIKNITALQNIFFRRLQQKRIISKRTLSNL